MRSRRLTIYFLVFLLPTLACQLATRTLHAENLRTITPSPLEYTREASPPPFIPTAIPPPTASPAPTATLTPTSTPHPTPAAWQEDVFEDLWQTVHDEYLYPDFNGLDWSAIHSEYQMKIQSGLSEEQFYAAMREMITQLGDDHSVFLSPDEVRQEDAEFAGNNDYVGIGVLTKPVPERQRVTIILVFPGSPAEAAGLSAHDSILEVDGQPIFDGEVFHRELLRGRVGSKVELTVQTPGQGPRQVSLSRERVTGAVPVPFTELSSSTGKRIGYILLATFADETIDDQVGKALQALSEEGKLDGLILDNRQNGGGSDYVARGVLSYFTRGVVGYFFDRRQERRVVNIVGRDIHGSQDVPLVVLVGPDTVSFGEIFSGVLQDKGRAYLIGETTEGNIELLWGYDFEDGSRAWIAHESFRPRNHPDQDWEKTGIIPDREVISNWDEVSLETDPAIQAALEYLEGKSPSVYKYTNYGKLSPTSFLRIAHPTQVLRPALPLGG